jgi:glycosyltransferase involved in cell wall biosynthesis
VTGAAGRRLVVGVDGRELQGRPTGTGRYLRNLLRQWAAADRDRLVVFFDGPPPDDRVLAAPALEARRVADGGTRGVTWLERHLPRAARGVPLDVFFSPAYVCPLRLDVPRVIAVHDVSFRSLPGDFTLLDGLRRRTLVGASLAAASGVLACSEFTRRELAAWHPGVASRVRVVPLGPDDDLPQGPPRDEARRRLGTGAPRLLSVGAILNRRRLPVLIEAAARLRRRWPGLVLDVVGDNRTHPRLDLRALVERRGLAGAVALHGFVGEAELALRYAAADVAVFLSEYEGFGLPALEALARGVPVVAARRPALDELFGEAALLVEPSDPGAVAAAVERLLGDAGLRDERARAGRELAARFSWTRAAAETRAALEAAAP